ncbi:hypothetical protein BYT27DRAFT_7224335 [Phlegmacium glaucopus]|nr:hypothetical protein BYT27DRAFT_7224335 [Phlegmacium glaucopus]
MKSHYKPLSDYRIISLTSCAVLFVAFLLFLLVGLSLTIIKPIFLLAVRSTATETQPLSIATELRFGVWGVCATSDLNKPTISNAGTCYGPMLSYNVSSFVQLNDAGISPEIVDIVEQALLVVLVLHPIVAGLSFLSVGSSLFLASHAFSIFTLILTIITALVATLSLAIDLALVLVARNRVATLGSFKLAIDFGNGVWMIVTAVILTWIAVVLLSARACYCLGVRRHVSVLTYCMNFN